MGEFYDDLIAAGQTPDRPGRPAGNHPTGWEPGITMTGNTGTVSTGPLSGKPDWSKVLQIWDLDPTRFDVCEPVQMRAWDAAIGDGKTQRMFYYKANIVTRQVGGVDVELMFKQIRTFKPKPSKVTAGEQAFIWSLADLQIGKGDGDGTPGTVNRFLESISAIKRRIEELRKIGRSLGQLYVAGLGDCIENIAGHYSSQTSSVDLNMTQQVRVIRRLLVKGILEIAPMFDQVCMVAVPGNHGEAVRSNGKAITTASDNWDVECFVAAHEVITQHPAYEHVRLLVPHGNNLDVTVDMAGTTVTLVHGHQFPASSGRTSGAMRWWADQAHGMQPAGDSTVMLGGHFHHLKVERQGYKTFIQSPASDGGSEWWRNLTGQESPPGVLTLVAGGGHWSDLAVI